MDLDVIGKIDQACNTAEEFTKLYYKNMDKSRHVISKLYMDTGVLVWNGNGMTGDDRIQKFILELPASEHVLNTLDAQPIVDSSISSQQTLLIQVSGTVRFTDYQVSGTFKYTDKLEKSFQQTFMITAQGDKWKIVSDCFRLLGPTV